MSFHFYSSNKLEELADLFKREVYSKTQPDPLLWLKPEVVITQTKGVADWLMQRLAIHSIAINVEFPFINKFIHSVFHQIGNKNFSLMDREHMTWDIFSIIDNYPEAEKYISNDDLKRFQLSEKLAELFDQYQIYHGEKLESWRNGNDEDWIGRLYKQLSTGKYSLDQGFLDFAQMVKSQKIELENSRVSLFGVSTMPESYFGFFKNLAEICQVHFFYLAPCGEFWEDTITPKEAKYRGTLPRGNQLLAALGIQGRNFHHILNEADQFAEFEVTQSDTMLQRLQKDIWSNRICGEIVDDFQVGELKINPYTVDEKDRSIQVHNCHTPLREVEVLHDQLLHLLENEPSLEPQNIIVMAPNITKYEPYIRAVFGNGPLKWHFALCDRSIKNINQVAGPFLALLELCVGRFEASKVLDLLESPALLIRKRIGEEEFDNIRSLVIAAGIRWGIDADQRQELCQVAFEEYSWKRGFDRLLSGYALSPWDDCPDRDIVPIDSCEGLESLVLGEFIQMINSLFDLRKTLEQQHSLKEWSNILLEILSTYFDDDNDYYLDTTIVRNAIIELGEHDNLLEGEKFSLSVVRYILNERFGDVDNAEPFLQAKITFCSMLPMRSIPMDVVAVLGLNDGEFPRNNFVSEFNVLPVVPGKIDRSPNLEDRFMFLEAILAARKYLLLFYQGRNGKNNSIIPPAVPLGELMEQVRLSFKWQEDENCKDSIDNLETFHKLQPFDFDYFFDNKKNLFSYSKVNRQGAMELQNYFKALSEDEKSSVKNVRMHLKQLDLKEYELPKTVNIEDLINFFISPQKYFLKRNCDLSLKTPKQVGIVDEELVLVNDDNLLSYNLRCQIAEGVIDNRDLLSQYHKMQKSNMLSIGENGWIDFNNLNQQLDFLNSNIKINGSERLVKDEIHKAINNYPLVVKLSDNLSVIGMLPLIPAEKDFYYYIYWRAGKFAPKYAITWYLRHLLFAGASQNFVQKDDALSLGFFTDESPISEIRGISCDKAKQCLEELVEIYREGQTQIIDFFPCSGYEYIRTLDLKKAQKCFYSFDKFRKKFKGDWCEPEVAIMYDNDEFVYAVSENCLQIANKVFAPFIKPVKVKE